MLKRLILVMCIFSPSVFAETIQMLDKVVAEVNDGVITQRELDHEVQEVTRQLASRKMPIPAKDALKRQVLKHLIDVKLELQLAKINHIDVDTVQVNQAIENIAKTNHLSMDELKKEIQRQGMSWDTYYSNVRKELLMSRIQQNAVGGQIHITKKQVNDYLHQMKTETRPDDAVYHVENILIPLPDEPTSASVMNAEKKAKALLKKIHQGANFNQLAIEESSGTFALEGGDLGERHLAELPAVFAKNVAEMKIGEVRGPIRAGNGFHLLKLISVTGQTNKHAWTQTHVRHVLIKPDATMSQEEASKQALHVYQEIQSGKSFEMIAKQYSLDPVSAVKGGDLGWVNPGELLPEFETAMNALPLHQVSKPVHSAYGWHIMEVLERKQVDDSKTFRITQVRSFLMQRQYTEAVERWLQKTRGEAYVRIIDKSLS